MELFIYCQNLRFGKIACWLICVFGLVEFLGKLVFTLTSCHSSSWSPKEASNKPTEVIIIDIWRLNATGNC